MKRKFIYLFLTFVIITNIYLIFCWEPQNKITTQKYLSKENISYSESLYKLDKEKALEQLSADDKKDFEKIIKRLSTFDIGKIKEYYKDSNEKQGMMNIFALLKKRLTTQDYKKIERISSSFVDLD